jgi:hypothetical protein
MDGGGNRPVTIPPPPAGGWRRYALLVGVTKYDNQGGLNDLSYPDTDVADLAKVLLKNGYKQEDVVQLTTGLGARDPAAMPTAANIRAQAAKLAARCGPNDLILVALSGHGHQPDGRPAFFCAYGTDLRDESTMVSVEAMAAELAKSSAGMRVLLVDACRDGGSRSRKRDFGEGFDTVTSQPAPGVITYYSCAKGERSWEIDSLQHGLFFDLLIKGLQGHADDYADGRVTWTELVGYVERTIPFEAAKYRKFQTPHFKGETVRQIPLAEFPVESAPPQVELAASDLLAEDFKMVKSGQMPRGWQGEGFERRFDEALGRAYVEVRRPDGVHWLRPPAPRTPLYGDFTVEMEFQLNGHRNHPNRDVSEHTLYLCLEGEDGATVLVSIDHEGAVAMPGVRPGKTKRFKMYDINRLRLVRDGGSYSLYLNDGMAASTALPYTGAFETFRIGMVGGIPCRDKGHELAARLYSVKAALLQGKDGGMPAAPAVSFGRVVLNEEFGGSLGARLPQGWSGEGFSLTHDERYERRCLEVNKAEGEVFWMTLPKLDEALGKGRDFYVEAECFLNAHRGNYDTNKPAHALHLRFEGPNALPLHVVLDHAGKIAIDDDLPKESKAFVPFVPNRLRLVRKNGSYRVAINEAPLLDVERGAADFDTLRIGLTGGVPNKDEKLDDAARLYGVKVVALPGKGAAAPAFRGVHQDFRTARSDRPPEGWTFGNVGAKAELVRLPNGVRVLSRPKVSVLDAEAKGGLVSSPAFKLAGDWTFVCEFEMPTAGAGIGVALLGEKGTPLVVQIGSEESGTPYLMAVGKFPPAELKDAVKRDFNRLEVGRRGNAIGFKLNGRPVGTVPASSAPGTVERVQVSLVINEKRAQSPELLRVTMASAE